MENALFRNEFIMAPLKLGYCHDKDGKVNARHLAFYKERASHLGAVIAEPFYIDKGLRENPFQLGIDSDDKIEGISQIANIVHAAGARFVVHINHPGRMANAAIPGNYFVSSSDLPCENGGATPVAMDEAMMETELTKLVNAALRAQKAGADYLELQFGHGYLLSQFLSPQINQRTDEYGGNFENRLRFPLRVLKAIQSEVKLPVIARISATDFQPGGITLEESIQLARRLQEEGVVALHVTAGSACSAPAWYYQHMFTPKGKTWEMAARIQQEVSVPVIFHGRIHSAEDVEMLKNTYGARYLSIGRALVADELFVAKMLGHSAEPVRPCLACSEGCLGGVRGGKGLGCVVNPRVNRELPVPEPAEKKRKIAVAGAGLAGLEAAITLKKRGHEVVVFEPDEIGGQFRLAYLPPHKSSLYEIVEYYQRELKRLQIPLRHEKVDNALLHRENFDEVIMATGAKPVVPSIQGLDHYYGAEILQTPGVLRNQTVVVVGGGLIGVEIASHLLDYQNKVIIVEMMDEIARGLEMIERNLTLARFRQHNVQIILNHKVVEVDGKTLRLVSKDGQETLLENVDAIVISIGMQPYRPFEPDIPAHYVGDAARVAKAQEAISDAYELALKIG